MMKRCNFQKILYRFATAVLFILILPACSDKDDPAPVTDDDNLLEATSVGSWAASQLQLFVQLSGQDIDINVLKHDVEVYRVVYTTTFQEKEIEASGLVILPKTASAAVPMLSFQRGTIVQQSQAPSEQEIDSEQVISYSALGSTGFITVVPDLIGFGESREIFHPYYIEEPTADAVIDLLRAARTLADDLNIAFDGQLFLAGYSQGGYATMAAHKAIEAEPVEGFDLVASFPGAGGYDVAGMLEYLRQQETYQDPYYLAFVGMSYQSYYDEPDLVGQFFNEPYASRIPTLFDGINSNNTINGQLTTDIPALVQEVILSNPEGSPLYDFLIEKFRENSLTDWTPVAPVFMYHGSADLTVPLINSEDTFEALLSNGANADDLQLTVFEGRDHTTAVEPYVVEVVQRLQEMI